MVWLGGFMLLIAGITDRILFYLLLAIPVLLLACGMTLTAISAWSACGGLDALQNVPPVR